MTRTNLLICSMAACSYLVALNAMMLPLDAAPLTAPPARANNSESASGGEPASEADRLKKAADQALSVGNYASAADLCAEAIKALPRGDSGKEAALRDNLAQALFFQGKLKESRREVAKALSLANKTFGRDSLEAARELDGMAWLLEAEGELDKAHEYCSNALRIRQEKLSATDGDLADSLEHAGWLAEKRSLYSEADQSYRQALPIREMKSGASSIATADVLERLGVVTRLLGNGPASQPLFGRALSIKESTGAVFQGFAPQSVDKRAVFRFFQGAPNCQNDFAGGTWMERITAAGVTVEASVVSRPSEFVKSSRAMVRVVNSSNQNVGVLSQPPRLMIIAPHMQLSRYVPGEELARKIETKGEHKAKSVWENGKNAVTPVYGNYWTPFGYYDSDYHEVPWRTRTVMVPDLEARARAAQKASEISAKSQAEAGTTRSQALGPVILAAGSMVQGSCDFDRCDFDNAILTIPVGNAVFEFRFDRKKLW